MKQLCIFIILIVFLLCIGTVYANMNGDFNFNQKGPMDGDNGMGGNNHGYDHNGPAPAPNQINSPPPRPPQPPQPTTGTGTIIVTDNTYGIDAGVQFLLTDPDGSVTEETTPHTFTNMQTGTYRVQKLGSPDYISSSLSAGNTLNFVI